MTIVYHWIAKYGYAALFSGMMLGIIGLPIPDETLLTFAGYLVSNHTFEFRYALLTAWVGSISGISVSYELGCYFGLPLLRNYGHHFFLTEDRLLRAQRWYRRIGKWSLLIGFFVPGIRHLTAFAAGTSGLQYRSFGLYAYSGAIIWSSTFILLGRFVGKEWKTVGEEVRNKILLIAGVVAMLVTLFFFIRWLQRYTREICSTISKRLKRKNLNSSK